MPLAQKTVRLNPANPAGQLIEAHVMTLLHQTARAQALLQEAMEKTPSVTMRGFLAWSFLYEHDLEPSLSSSPGGPGDRAAMRVWCARAEPDLRKLPASEHAMTLEARIKFAIDANGKVTRAEGVSGPEPLIGIVRDWLPGCRYEPAQHEGQPVDGELEQRFVFVGH